MSLVKITDLQTMTRQPVVRMAMTAQPTLTMLSTANSGTWLSSDVFQPESKIKILSVRSFSRYQNYSVTTS